MLRLRSVQDHLDLRAEDQVAHHRRNPLIGPVAWSAYFLFPPTINACRRSVTFASRLLSGSNPYACSIVARIDVVSCAWWSTPDLVKLAPMISAGMRVPGP